MDITMNVEETTMEWILTKDGNFDTYVLKLEDATLKVFTAMPKGTFEYSMGLVVLDEGGTLPVFNAENKNAYGPLERIKQMTIETYKHKDIALEAWRNEKVYGNLIFG